MTPPTSQSYWKRLRTTIHHLSGTRRVVFIVVALGIIIGGAGLVRSVFLKGTTVQPARGGSVTEGVVGVPRFVNPILADSLVDRDLTQLVFSGLMRRNTAGTLVPDIASSYEVSEDGKTYTFTLREDIRFHDGNRITAGDVVYTVNQTQVSTIQSPRRDAWKGISVTAPDNQTVVFTLPQPFAGFLAQTTLGILPSHVWQNVPTEQVNFSAYNTNPVGSGPFTIEDIKRGKAGTPTAYRLRPYRGYWLGQPYLRRLTIAFYPTETELSRAFSRGDIDTMSAISPRTISNTSYNLLVSTTLPRVFGLFFNTTKQPLFGDADLVEALEYAIDKEDIITTVLGGFGAPLSGPLPPTLGTLPSESAFDVATANRLLEEAGWVYENPEGTVRQKNGQPLQFSIATSDVPELKQTAEIIKRDLANVGVLATINVFEIGNLELDIIQPRNFEALLFGQVIRHDTDMYAFWHSSQTGLDGLNITGYENSDVDEALENALVTLDKGLRTNLYRTVEEEITADRPAIFLYAPDFVYMTNRNIGNFDIGTITQPADRLGDSYRWFVATERIWKFFNTTTNR